MSRSPKRYRGVVLTQQGIDRLEAAIATAQDEEKYGKRFTQAELAERTDLSIKTIKKIRKRTAPVDEASVRTLFEAFGLELETADYGLPELSTSAEDNDLTVEERPSTAKIDWGEKPDTAIFFGRTEELATLGQWMMAEPCRLVTLLGMGGIGKTSLAAKLADQIYQQFDYVIWRSLREAPPLDEILVRLIQFLSDQQETEINLPSRLGERIIRLLHYLRSHRCLLVLDNLESILQAESTGQFRDGYEGYGELIRRIGEAEHQSCLLLTSRECPRELAPMAGDRLPVRLWSVTGIDTEAGREILKAKGLELDEADTQGQELIRRYSGNPQALHLVATAIQREFLGDVDDFLEEEGAAVEDVRSLLDQHLTRLAPLERSILFWLAINREPVGLEELMEDLLPPVTKREVRSALRGLSDRYLIETVGKQFSLQNVIMEFVTDRFVERVSEELSTQQFDLFHTHALIKATAKDYVRQTQIRLILKPVINLATSLRNLSEIIASQKHKKIDNLGSYLIGNFLNILVQQEYELTNFSFSGLSIRQVSFQDRSLKDVDFSNSKFQECVFSKTFSSLLSISISPNNQLMAAGDTNGSIFVWRLQDSEFYKCLDFHKGWVRSLKFSEDSDLLVSGSEDRRICIWNIHSGDILKILEGHEDKIYAIDINPQGSLIGSASVDETVRIWDIATGSCIKTVHAGQAYSIDFGNDIFAIGSTNGRVYIYDAKTYESLKMLSALAGKILSVKISKKAKIILAGDSTGNIKAWNINNGKLMLNIQAHSEPIRSIVISPDENTFISTGEDRLIKQWSLGSGEFLGLLSGHCSWVTDAAFDSSGEMLASCGSDLAIRLWDMKTGNCLRNYHGYMNRVLSIDINAEKGILISGHSDTSVRFWDINNKSFSGEFFEPKAWVESICFNPEDSTLVIDSGNQVKIINTKNNAIEKTFSGHEEGVITIAILPDSSIMATGSSDHDVRLWDMKTGKCIRVLHGHESWVNSICFSQSEKNILASGSSDRKVKIWNVLTGECLSGVENS
jgi:WD40 repeat protein/transcriptional regulator with XRE-family HTH domain